MTGGIKMLEVCFSESEVGGLKIAFHKKEIVWLWTQLQLGQIDDEHFLSARREWSDRFYDICDESEREKIFLEEKQRVENSLCDISSRKEIRVWFASAPYSKCGLYYLVHFLQNVDIDIYAVEMPQGGSGKELDADCSWFEIDARDLERYTENTRLLSREERTEIALKWEKLKQENAPLRINCNGEIVSVAEDYFDEEIMRCVPNGEFKMIRLIGDMMGKSKHSVGDTFVKERIYHLIAAGKLIVVKKVLNEWGDDRHSVLRKA
jgi:hypothetical protein